MKKWIKKFALALTAVVTAFCLSACFEQGETSSSEVSQDIFTYDYETYKEQVVSIDLIDYTPENVQYLLYSTKKKTTTVYETFERENATVVEVLPEEEMQGFLQELSEREVYAPLQESMKSNFTNPCGRSARITYQDGSFHLISWCECRRIQDGYEYIYNEIFLTYYDSNGTVIESRSLNDMNDQWYIFVMAYYFDAKVYPLTDLVEYEEVKIWNVG